MVVAINSEILMNEAFSSEAELQSCIEKNPSLLLAETEEKIIYSHRELNLPAAGFLDLFFIDESGTPIAVEVKLARNGQSRREVVAQAFDYVSDLSNITIDELDAIVDGTIFTALNELESETNLWRACATNLRAGLIKVVIAVDDANEDLVRIVRYINDHSDLDVRLVTVGKYRNGDILVPNIVVKETPDNQWARLAVVQRKLELNLKTLSLHSIP